MKVWTMIKKVLRRETTNAVPLDDPQIADAERRLESAMQRLGQQDESVPVYLHPSYPPRRSARP